MPARLDAPFFPFALFVPQFPLYPHKDNMEIHKIGYFFCVIYKPQIPQKISPTADACVIAITNMLIWKIRGEEFDL